MDFMPMGSILDCMKRLEEQGKKGLRWIVNTAWLAAIALEEFHTAGLIHRDVAARNLLMDRRITSFNGDTPVLRCPPLTAVTLPSWLTSAWPP